MLTQKLSPPAGKVSRRSRDERGTTQSRQVKRDVPPSASPTLSSSPINGGAFWCGTSSNIKPALTGRWPRAKRADGGVASALLLFTATPQSIRLTAYCQLPVKGSLLVRYTSSHIKQTRGRLPVPTSSQALTLTRRQADFTWRSHISHCESNISPCVSRISLRT